MISPTSSRNVDVVALSIMTSGQMQIARDLIPGLKRAGLDDVLVIMGGIIPEVDFEPLMALGVHRVFMPGQPGSVVADYIRANVGEVSLP